MSDFEAFTREKIARLRLEADALEKILKEFVGSRARSTGASAKGGNAATGGFGAVMDALANAGQDGMSLDDMIAAASEQGFEVLRNTLRSQLWSAKHNGKVEQLAPGHYRIALEEPETPAPPPPRPEPDVPRTSAVRPPEQPQGPPWRQPSPPPPADDDIPF